jgi:hypothetical protein
MREAYPRKRHKIKYVLSCTASPVVAMNKRRRKKKECSKAKKKKKRCEEE